MAMALLIQTTSKTKTAKTVKTAVAKAAE